MYHFTNNIIVKQFLSNQFITSLKILQNYCATTSQNYNCTRLKGKTAVVTASTDGIGFAIAERLATEGANVIISSRKLDNVNRAVDKLKNKGFTTNVLGIKCHVADKEDRQNLFKETQEHFGGVDILISNAAVNPTVGSILDCTEEIWDKIFDVNVKASFLLAKEALPYLKERYSTGGSGGAGISSSGNIIFISSIAGYLPMQSIGAYSVSKTTLLGLTKAISQDLTRHNIRVNCVAPGIIRTKFAAALHENETAKKALFATIPMERLGEPHEIAGVVAFLVSDDASYITGESIVASGGSYSRL